MLVKLFAIAANTLLEAVRQPIYGVILMVTAGLLMLNVALAGFTLEDDNKLLQDLGLSTLLLSGLFLAAFSATARFRKAVSVGALSFAAALSSFRLKDRLTLRLIRASRVGLFITMIVLLVLIWTVRPLGGCVKKKNGLSPSSALICGPPLSFRLSFFILRPSSLVLLLQPQDSGLSRYSLKRKGPRPGSEPRTSRPYPKTA